MQLAGGLMYLALAGLYARANAAGVRQNGFSELQANPIRKVVTMLQAMQKKVTEEGEKEKELYEKFMCYCSTGKQDLTKSIEAATTKSPALASQIKAGEEHRAQLKDELAQAQEDRAEAKTAIADATKIREKEAAEFATLQADYSANIGAITKAVAALEKGMAGAFLQTEAAQVLKKLVLSKPEMADREDILSFLSGGDGSSYAPSGGEIVGILKRMGDEMASGLAEATHAEESAIHTFQQLMSAKTAEVNALIASIETKMQRLGELDVQIAMMKNDLTDTEEALLEDQTFLQELEKGCTTKSSEWAERSKTRQEELVALAETIRVLNDDDALELFKKTLPSAASSSLVQMTRSSAALRTRALAMLQKVRTSEYHPQLDLIMLALHGKKIGFEKVIKMIDEMAATLKQEQLDDDSKKEYCGTQLDLADDKKKTLERSVSDSETEIESAKEGIAAATDEIATLVAGIKTLDKSVSEATDLRKAQHEEFQELMSSNSAAKELLGFAKNRLNKFYNPKMYKAPPKTELSAMDRTAASMGAFAQISAHRQHKDAPAPPPTTWDAYAKKTEETGGVMAMIELLIKDLDKEMTEAETEERDAQSDYEALMRSSATKRAEDSKSLAHKKSAKADLEENLLTSKEAKASASKELGATLKFTHSLHIECDWLLKYYDVRKEARAGEIDALGQAKAVLSGADFSLMQTFKSGRTL